MNKVSRRRNSNGSSNFSNWFELENRIAKESERLKKNCSKTVSTILKDSCYAVLLMAKNMSWTIQSWIKKKIQSMKYWSCELSIDWSQKFVLLNFMLPCKWSGRKEELKISRFRKSSRRLLLVEHELQLNLICIPKHFVSSSDLRWTFQGSTLFVKF